MHMCSGTRITGTNEDVYLFHDVIQSSWNKLKNIFHAPFLSHSWHHSLLKYWQRRTQSFGFWVQLNATPAEPLSDKQCKCRLSCFGYSTHYGVKHRERVRALVHPPLWRWCNSQSVLSACTSDVSGICSLAVVCWLKRGGQVTIDSSFVCQRLEVVGSSVLSKKNLCGSLEESLCKRPKKKKMEWTQGCWLHRLYFTDPLAPLFKSGVQ